MQLGLSDSERRVILHRTKTTNDMYEYRSKYWGACHPPNPPASLGGPKAPPDPPPRIGLITTSWWLSQPVGCYYNQIVAISTCLMFSVCYLGLIATSAVDYGSIATTFRGLGVYCNQIATNLGLISTSWGLSQPRWGLLQPVGSYCNHLGLIATTWCLSQPGGFILICMYLFIVGAFSCLLLARFFVCCCRVFVLSLARFSVCCWRVFCCLSLAFFFVCCWRVLLLVVAAFFRLLLARFFVYCWRFHCLLLARVVGCGWRFCCLWLALVFVCCWRFFVVCCWRVFCL